MEYLQNRRNLIVYLKTDLDKLMKRTDNFSNRGIVFNGLSPQELYNERDILYSKYSDLTIETKNYNIEFLAKMFRFII